MDADTIGLFCNPTAGSGKLRVQELTRLAFECLQPQVSKILVAPGEMGAAVCCGKNTRVVVQDLTHSRLDTIETAKAMVSEGAQLLMIVAGDGTYNDALEGMQSLGRVDPFYGIAGGRFNTIFLKRKHEPFVSQRGLFRPFRIRDLVTEDVMGIRTSLNGVVVSYAFFLDGDV